MNREVARSQTQSWDGQLRGVEWSTIYLQSTVAAAVTSPLSHWQAKVQPLLKGF
jgi:hypothetical protein